MSSPFNKI